MNTYDKGLMWFRRDLRAEDNAALYHALKSCRQVWCVFVLDTEILEPLMARGLTADRRVAFIRESLVQLDARLRAMGREHGTEATGLIVRHARARDEIPALARQLQVQAVFANHDDEPAAHARDAHVLGQLAHEGIMFHGHKDHVIFERREVLTQAGHAFGVFTPYKNAWLRQVDSFQLKPYPVARYAASLGALPGPVGGEWNAPVPRLSDIDFEPIDPAQLKGRWVTAAGVAPATTAVVVPDANGAANAWLLAQDASRLVKLVVRSDSSANGKSYALGQGNATGQAVTGQVNAALAATGRMLRMIDPQMMRPEAGAQSLSRLEPFSPYTLLASLPPLIEGPAQKNGTQITLIGYDFR